MDRRTFFGYLGALVALPKVIGKVFASKVHRALPMTGTWDDSDAEPVVSFTFQRAAIREDGYWFIGDAPASEQVRIANWSDIDS